MDKLMLMNDQLNAVIDRTIITGRSAAAVIDFAFAIIEKLEGRKKAEEVKASIYY